MTLPRTANLEHSSEEDRDTRPKESIPLKRKLKKSPSLEWSYDIEQPPSFQELAPKGNIQPLFERVILV